LIAIAGADLQPSVAGQRVPYDRPLWLNARTKLEFHHARNGCYAYLGVGGGIATPTYLASRSTHLRSRIGGCSGRALQAGDQIPVGEPTPRSVAISQLLNRRSTTGTHSQFGEELPAERNALNAAHWFVDHDLVDPTIPSNAFRVIPGRHFEQLDTASQTRFWRSEFSIALASDRMGYWLEGPELRFREAFAVPSAGVARGTIQMPVGGNMIVLMADSAATGGYPNIAHVASVDSSRLAQVQPGQRILFQPIELENARGLLVSRQRRLEQVRRAIDFRIKSGTK
jgi:antagonist of KipI